MVPDADLVARVDHLVETAEVIAVLMADDGVVEARGRRDSDGREVGDDPGHSPSGFSGLEEDRGSVRPFQEDRASPTDVDVVDLERLRGEMRGPEEDEGEGSGDGAAGPHGYWAAFFSPSRLHPGSGRSRCHSW